MPEQHATTVQQTAVPASAAQMPTVGEPAPAIAEPARGDEWDEPIEELPPRPRRRLLGAGGNPIAAGAARGAADRLRVHRRRARREGSDLLELVGRRRSRSRLTVRRAARRLRHGFQRIRRRRRGRGRLRGERIGRRRERDRRSGRLHRREHAVRDRRRRQHREGQDIGGLDRDQDRESRRRGHSSGRNRHRHGSHGREGRDQRRIDPRRRCEPAAASARCSAVRAAAGAVAASAVGPEEAAHPAAANPRCSAKAASEPEPTDGTTDYLADPRSPPGGACVRRHDHRKGALMSHIDSNRRKPAATAVARSGPTARQSRAGGLRRRILEHHASTSANASATTPGRRRTHRRHGPPERRAVQRAARMPAEERVTLPKRTPGQRRGGPGGPSGPGGFLGGEAAPAVHSCRTV